MAEGVAGVYAIVCKPSGEVYVGQSTDVAMRWFAHRLALRRGEHFNRALQRAWASYGEEAFTFELLEAVTGSEALRLAEARWMGALGGNVPGRGFYAELPAPQRRPPRPARVASAVEGAAGGATQPSHGARSQMERGDDALLAMVALERGANAVALWIERALPDLRLTQAEAHVLAYLTQHAPCSINDLHRSFGHKRSTLTSLLDRLEGRGWGQRAAHPQSRRLVMVQLTEVGHLAGERVSAAVRTLENRLHAHAGADTATFLHVLQFLEEELSHDR